MGGDIKVCPLCNREFGIFRHRYTCAACKNIYCDDCTPNKYVIPPDTSAEKVCTVCEKQLSSHVRTKDGGRRLGGDAGGGASDAQNVAERERRAQVAQQRSQPAAPAKKKHQAPRSSPPRDPVPTAAPQPQGRTLGSGASGNAGSGVEETNPVLAAALKRQQQGAHHSSSGQGAHMDQERQKLLAEIQAVLRSKDQEEPFGLRAMDATKMRMYLRDLRAAR